MDTLFQLLQTKQVAFSSLVLLFFAYQRFNTWTTQELQLPLELSEASPRDTTSFARFTGGVVIYWGLHEMLFLIVVGIPEILDLLGVVFPEFLTGAEKWKAFSGEGALWVLTIVVGIAPNVAAFRSVDERVRKRIHELSYIPSAVSSIVNQLVTKRNTFRPDTNIVEKVLSEAPSPVLAPDFFDNPSSTPEHKWCKLQTIFACLQQVEGEPKYNGFMLRNPLRKSRFEAGVSACSESMNRLVEVQNEVSEMTASSTSSDDAIMLEKQRLVDALSKGANQDLRTTLLNAYELIAHMIFSTNWSPKAVAEEFSRFGLYPLLTLGATRSSAFLWVLPILVVAVSIFSVFIDALIRDDGLVVYDAMELGFVAALSHYAAVQVSLWFSLSRNYVSLDADGVPRQHNQFGTFALAVICGFLGLVAGDLILIGKVMLGGGASGLDSVVLWGLVTAVSGAFVPLYTNSKAPNKFLLVFSQAIFTALAAMLVNEFYELAGEGPADFKQFSILSAASIGGIIGLLFIYLYQSGQQSLRVREERRSEKRISVGNDVELIGDDSFKGATIDCSSRGIAVSPKIAAQPGQSVDLWLAGRGRVTCSILRQDDSLDRSALAVEDDEPGKQIILNLIHSHNLVHGKV